MKPNNGNFLVLALGVLGLAFVTIQSVSASHVDDRYGVFISVAPQKYDFTTGETLVINGEVHAYRNNFPVVLKVFNTNNAACNFQQISLNSDMTFTANPVRLGGALCGVAGEYKITAHYGSGKALSKFNVSSPRDELSGGKVEVINTQIISNFIKADNKYPVDLDWSTNAVRLRNNMDATVSFYIMFAEFDSNEVTKGLSYKEVTLKPHESAYVNAPSVPQIINGKPNGYLHVFAWNSLNNPTPLHPGLYVPY